MLQQENTWHVILIARRRRGAGRQMRACSASETEIKFLAVPRVGMALHILHICRTTSD
jgi:hypothetical protein